MTPLNQKNNTSKSTGEKDRASRYLSLSAFGICKDFLYAIKLYNVSTCHGTLMLTYNVHGISAILQKRTHTHTKKDFMNFSDISYFTRISVANEHNS